MSVSVITVMQFTIDNKDLIKWLWLSKNYGQKCFVKILFWQKMKSYWVKDIDRKISARSLTLVIFAVQLCRQFVVNHDPYSPDTIKCVATQKDLFLLQLWLAYYIFRHKKLVVWKYATMTSQQNRFSSHCKLSCECEQKSMQKITALQ